MSCIGERLGLAGGRGRVAGLKKELRILGVVGGWF